MAILTLKVVNLTHYNLKDGQFKIILTLKVVIFDLKVIKNGFGISAGLRFPLFLRYDGAPAHLGEDHGNRNKRCST